MADVGTQLFHYYYCTPLLHAFWISRRLLCTFNMYFLLAFLMIICYVYLYFVFDFLTQIKLVVFLTSNIYFVTNLILSEYVSIIADWIFESL
jgi:hypothetical protein